MARKRKERIRACLEEAAANYIKVNGPASSIAIAQSGRLNSGKLLKDCRFGLTSAQVSLLLRYNPRFTRTGNLWRLKD